MDRAQDATSVNQGTIQSGRAARVMACAPARRPKCEALCVSVRRPKTLSELFELFRYHHEDAR
jgi:hypothetical protein